ncbi:MAG: hypothetical protein HC906_01175 [Bacteroidales bacterium]|nr:hypothetical protein [Bacteroidales bacterium]
MKHFTRKQKLDLITRLANGEVDPYLLKLGIPDSCVFIEKNGKHYASGSGVQVDINKITIGTIVVLPYNGRESFNFDDK